MIAFPPNFGPPMKGIKRERKVDKFIGTKMVAILRKKRERERGEKRRDKKEKRKEKKKERKKEKEVSN